MNKRYVLAVVLFGIFVGTYTVCQVAVQQPQHEATGWFQSAWQRAVALSAFIAAGSQEAVPVPVAKEVSAIDDAFVEVNSPEEEIASHQEEIVTSPVEELITQLATDNKLSQETKEFIRRMEDQFTHEQVLDIVRGAAIYDNLYRQPENEEFEIVDRQDKPVCGRYEMVGGRDGVELCGKFGLTPEEGVRALIRYLYAQGLDKGQEFTEGAFVLVDPDFAVLRFLKAAGCEYQRTSSHLNKFYTMKQKEQQVSSGWFGAATDNMRNMYQALPADLRVLDSYSDKGEEQHYGLNIDVSMGDAHMPHKTTLLFGCVDGDRTYIKPENYGTKTIAEWLIHGVEFAESIKRKFEGGDDAQAYRKERVPQQELKQFKTILNMIRENESAVTQQDTGYFSSLSTWWNGSSEPVQPSIDVTGHMKKAQAYGISYMHEQACSFLNELQTEQSASKALKRVLTQFIDTLEEEYDHIYFRVGREVIVSPADSQEIFAEADIDHIVSTIAGSDYVAYVRNFETK